VQDRIHTYDKWYLNYWQIDHKQVQ
jgi:hypothetical protein